MTDSIWSGKLLGAIGGGNMAEALVRGIIASGLVTAPRITVFDVVPARREVFASLGCAAAENVQEAARADVVLLATKPQMVEQALAGIKLRSDQVLVSIAAGVPCARLETLLGGDAYVIRVMPNTPLLVGQGMSALAAGANATADDMRLALALFESAGQAVEVTEDKLDAVTALSGSGPAYVFAFTEALVAGAEAIGLAPELAMQLVVGTLRGSAEMLARFGNPAKLREQVTSPGGTTAAALKVFGERDLPGMTAAALQAARDRSVELGRSQ